MVGHLIFYDLGITEATLKLNLYALIKIAKIL